MSGTRGELRERMWSIIKHRLPVDNKLLYHSAPLLDDLSHLAWVHAEEYTARCVKDNNRTISHLRKTNGELAHKISAVLEELHKAGMDDVTPSIGVEQLRQEREFYKNQFEKYGPSKTRKDELAKVREQRDELEKDRDAWKQVAEEESERASAANKERDEVRGKADSFSKRIEAGIEECDRFIDEGGDIGASAIRAKLVGISQPEALPVVEDDRVEPGTAYVVGPEAQAKVTFDLSMPNGQWVRHTFVEYGVGKIMQTRRDHAQVMWNGRLMGQWHEWVYLKPWKPVEGEIVSGEALDGMPEAGKKITGEYLDECSVLYNCALVEAGGIYHVQKDTLRPGRY